jgi:chromosome segregation protein
MYLEKLEVHGFKSFANKNKLIFSGIVDGEKRGLTAIVGPNGSGKSNVADSIRWALGEQSLKTLRGKKSEDVIFSGSDKKNQLGMAEVSLFLNNSESKRPVKLLGEGEVENELDQIIKTCNEIVITRRVYRSGESEYLLNGSRVRLSDIQMLLVKASFGQKTYSVIGQGMVENFLNGSTADRKDFFDEATGVKQFQIKRDSSLNKLEASYENLQQVDMLLSEIKPRLKSLTRQVEKLKKRSEIEIDLKTNQFNYYHVTWHEINKKLETANNKFLELEKVKQDREKKLTKLNEELNKIRNADNFQEINELQPQIRDLENQKNQQLKQLAKLQAELEVQLEAQGQFDVSWLNNKSEELKNELEKIESEINSSEKNNYNQVEDSLREELRDLDQDIDKNYQRRKQIATQEEEKNHYLKQITKLDAVLEANLEAQGQFDVSWLNNKNEELVLMLKNNTLEIEELRLQNNRETENELRKKLEITRAKIESLNQELNRIKNDLKKSNPKENSKEEISRVIEQFIKRLDDLKNETDLGKIKAEIEIAKKEFQTKIKIFIDGENAEQIQRIKDIQDELMVLTDERQNINNQLNEERLRLSSISERLRLLEDKERQTNREITDIKEKLAKAQVKFDATAIENEKQAINKKINVLDKEIDALKQEEKSRELQEKRQAIVNKINDSRLKSASLQERARLLNDKRNQLSSEVENIKIKLEKSQIKFDASSIEKEKTIINQNIQNLNSEIQSLNQKLDEVNVAKEKEKSQMFECQKNINSIQQEINLLSDEINNLKVEATRQETKLEDLEQTIRTNELNISEIINHKLKEAIIETERWNKKINEAKNQLEQIGSIDPETEKEYNETKERYDFLSKQTADLNEAIKSLEEIIYELDLNIKNRFDQEFKIISEKFNDYFKILFNGGSARIFKVMLEEAEKEENKNAEALQNGTAAISNQNILTNSEEKGILDEKLKKIKFLKKHNAIGLAGIEIQATPPGKKIQAVSMLSGGERALTAIALICAIISANPSPFVVLDEVDAALDESNSERLAKILDDLSDKTQFIVITHNRASMRRASILYGVTMESDGVSKLLSIKFEDLKK